MILFVDDACLKRGVKFRDWYLLRVGAQNREHVVQRLRIVDTHLQTLQVRWFAHRPAVVGDVAVSIFRKSEEFQAGRTKLFRHALPGCSVENLVGDIARGEHEGQFKGARFGNEAGEIVQAGHGDIDNAGTRAVDHLRIVAKLPVREDIDGDGAL